MAQRQPGNDFAISKRIVQWVRDALLAGVHLAAPDFARPFHLQTDASEDGKGAVLYQLLGCPVAQQYPYCSDKHSPTNMAIIAHYSKAFTEAQRLRPPYYLEADSLLWATNECYGSIETQEGRQASLGLSHDERDKCLRLKASKAGHRRERRNKNKGWPLFCSPSTLVVIIISN